MGGGFSKIVAPIRIVFKMETQTPKSLGFSMPAEWEEHSAIWLFWPHDTESFPHLEEAESAYANFVHEISQSEKVELNILHNEMQQRAERLLSQRGNDFSNIHFHTADYADIWIRDYGPTFVKNDAGGLALVKWKYNAYGNKYAELLKDNEVPYAMNKNLRLPLFESGIVLEGGSIEVNGCGTLMTTEQCLLNKNRNPELSREEIETYLTDYLGVSHFIWLKEGIEGDDTDGHIDDIARFVNENTVVCAYEEDTTSPNHGVLKANFEILKNSKDQDGHPLNVIKLPMPGEIPAHSKILPASYANFYIGNEKVLVPIFGTKNDAPALNILQSAFPNRKVIGINATYLVYGLGTFHCMSQQQPAT